MKCERGNYLFTVIRACSWMGTSTVGQGDVLQVLQLRNRCEVSMSSVTFTVCKEGPVIVHFTFSVAPF